MYIVLGMKINPLPSQQRLHEVLSYNESTGLFLWKVKVAQRSPAGSPAGTIANNRLLISVDKKLYYGHRLAWMYVTGEDPGQLEIDHKDGNPSNNKFSNLRLATRQENMRNLKRPDRNKTGYKGVFWDQKHPNKFGACIRAEGKNKRLGYFSTPEEAHEAYKSAAVTYFGDFSRFS